MSSLLKSDDARYSLLGDHESSDGLSSEHEKFNQSAPASKIQRRSCIMQIAAIALLIVAIIIVEVSLHIHPPSNSRVSKSLDIRREWRTLSKKERQEYVDAAVCLTKTSSQRDARVTIHDDFSYLHSAIGNYSHNAAPFLPWHRYFIFAYEKALKQHCGFKGILPYWDWSKDYKNVLKSPIWDTDAGFGPNGDITGPEGVSKGHCVRNGSFSEWNPAYYQGDYRPHCLSRGFLDTATAEERSMTTVKPNILEAVIKKETDFFNFTMEIEDVSHITVPYLVHGDFRRITAPNDPVFFLHHAQIDRLWWSWQRYSADRFLKYSGPARYGIDEEGGLTDLLNFGGILSFDPSVSDLMDTEGEMLHYRYDVSVVGEHQSHDTQ